MSKQHTIDPHKKMPKHRTGIGLRALLKEIADDPPEHFIDEPVRLMIHIQLTPRQIQALNEKTYLDDTTLNALARKHFLEYLNAP